MIALDNMFGESGPEGGYRLGMRAARFLGNNPSEARSLKRFIKDGYDVRSTIVHGGSDQVEQMVLKKFKRPLQDVIYEVQEYVRAALKRMLADPKQAESDYLDNLLLGG
jgi:hypothetical protein